MICNVSQSGTSLRSMNTTNTQTPTNPPTIALPHPVLGEVATCDRCAAKAAR